MNREDQQLIRRFSDLSRQAYQKNRVMFSDFLNMNELSLLYRGEKSYDTSFAVWGGYEYAERQMVSFQPDALYYEWQYPIVCLSFTPVNRRFAESLTHRDVLGAIMHLSIERSKIGDILVREDQVIVFCTEAVADVIRKELCQIRHTRVSGNVISGEQIHIVPDFEDCSGFVSSNRLDAFVAEICRFSRSQAKEALQSEKIFINGKCMTDSSHKLAPGDVISVRGFGKIIFDDFYGQSKKGRLGILYRKYK